MANSAVNDRQAKSKKASSANSLRWDLMRMPVRTEALRYARLYKIPVVVYETSDYRTLKAVMKILPPQSQ